MPEKSCILVKFCVYLWKSDNSTVAQLVEQSAVNRSVAGSSPACGVWGSTQVAEEAPLLRV